MKEKTYNITIFALCVASVAFAVKDFSKGLTPAERWIDWIIYFVFVADYIIRFAIAEKKAEFFKKNLLDLIAILPFNSALRIFRAFRFTKLLKLTKLFRAGSVSTRLLSRSRRFLDTNGFKYMILASIIAIVSAAFAMTYAEHMPLQDALWWSFVTATTVGYGDLSPASPAGRIIAMLLMLVGIGLIGSLTSTITSFFLESRKEESHSSDKVDMVMALYQVLSDAEKDEFKQRIQ